VQQDQIDFTLVCRTRYILPFGAQDQIDFVEELLLSMHHHQVIPPSCFIILHCTDQMHLICNGAAMHCTVTALLTIAPQHGTVNAFLKPMLQRDFISLLPKKVK
jgi:hypothetical protein